MCQALLKCLTTASVVVLTFIVGVAAPLPVGQREYDFVYDKLERQEICAVTRFDYQLGPYPRVDSAAHLYPFSNRTGLTDRQIQLFGFAAESFKSSRDRRGRMYALFRGGFVAQPFARVSVISQYYLDERKARDPNYTGKKWRGFAGDIDLAFAQYSTRNFDLTLGRFSSFWGVRKSLVLGANAPLDGFGYSLRLGRLTVSYRFGQLSQDSVESDTTTQWPNRYMAAHRIDWHLNDAFRFGLFESVVFGGPGRSPDFSYLNPIIFFHGAQLNDNINDNTLVGVDFTWRPRRGVKLYGQLLIDDIQLDHKSQGDEEPAEYALQFGVYTASQSKRIDTRIEYVRVTNRTFNQILERNRYVSGHDPIADVSGNDYDLTTAKLVRWLTPNLAARLSLSYKQQGEGRIDAPWSEPWLDVVGDYHEPFPTGTVEKTTTIALGVRGFANSILFIDLSGGLSRVVNYNNHVGDKRTLPFVECYVSLYFSKVIGLD
jgi:hypothetical protein